MTAGTQGIENNTVLRFQKKPRTTPITPESAVVNACIRWLYLNGVFVWRHNSGAYKPEGSNSYIRYGNPGSADIIGLTKSGRFLSIECKSTVGRLTDKQIAFGERIKACGGIYIVARSLDDLEAHRAEILGVL